MVLMLQSKIIKSFWSAWRLKLRQIRDVKTKYAMLKSSLQRKVLATYFLKLKAIGRELSVILTLK